jgi:23S rRNA pseudouridine1911/1915/1917 synthase
VREAVPAALDGERVDRLVAFAHQVSRSEATRLLSVGAVRLDGAVVTSGKQRVREGQVLEIDDDAALPQAAVLPEADVEVPIVWSDADVVVVDKPAGLVVHPGSGVDRGTLVNGLLHRFPELASVGDPTRPGIVHRLDRGTTGLLVVARTPEAYEALVAQLSAREVERQYAALVWGTPASPAGLVDAPIGRSGRDATKMAVTADGREARTRYEVRRMFAVPAATALLTCRLETGRTHQIRVHLAAIGHPVVGDAAYGGRRRAIALDRPFLHAERLSFVHPVSGERLTFEAPLPDDLRAVLDELR